MTSNAITTRPHRPALRLARHEVILRVAENTIDTRRDRQMIYGLQVAMRALEPPPTTLPNQHRQPIRQRIRRCENGNQRRTANNLVVR